MTYEETEIPDELKDDAEAAREAMVEAAAEANEEFMNKYVDTGELTLDEIKRGSVSGALIMTSCWQRAVRRSRTKGIQALLDNVLEFLPAPDEVRAITGVVDDDGTEETRAADDDAPSLPWRSRSPRIRSWVH